MIRETAALLHTEVCRLHLSQKGKDLTESSHGHHMILAQRVKRRDRPSKHLARAP